MMIAASSDLLPLLDVTSAVCVVLNFMVFVSSTVACSSFLCDEVPVISSLPFVIILTARFRPLWLDD